MRARAVGARAMFLVSLGEISRKTASAFFGKRNSAGVLRLGGWPSAGHILGNSVWVTVWISSFKS
jgi:hypothetical protein